MAAEAVSIRETLIFGVKRPDKKVAPVKYASLAITWISRGKKTED
jgi:hypothetical protein